METEQFAHKGEKTVLPDHDYLQYCGRIDFSDYLAPSFIYPYTSVTMAFCGTGVKVRIRNKRLYMDNYLGYVIDGNQGKILLGEDREIHEILIAEGLEDERHEIFLFKRMDGCHEFEFHGFVLEAGSRVLEPPVLKRKCMEVYGDSVSAGEAAEAVDYVRQPDPDNNGEYSNSYYSYAAIAARMLNCRLHNISQGGIALLNGTGWFHEPDYPGMESVYDKVRYLPDNGKVTEWNFKKYTPHVVIVAIGQNDASPEDYMKEDNNGQKAAVWREAYKKFILSLREKYPKALIVLTTTILIHSPKWDRAIGRVCSELRDPRIVHFLYSENGRGTWGHVRIPEAEQMALELTSFIRGFGVEIWE